MKANSLYSADNLNGDHREDGYQEFRSQSDQECHVRHVPDFAEVAAKLHRRSLKLTSQRQAILSALREGNSPLSIRQIHELLNKESDLATVYRTMHILEKSGLVQRCDFGDGVARYELTCECGNLHHYHLICTECLCVIPIKIEFPADILREAAERTGYDRIEPRLEFFGICPECRGAMK